MQKHKHSEKLRSPIVDVLIFQQKFDLRNFEMKARLTLRAKVSLVMLLP